jgi:hypothetical protein
MNNDFKATKRKFLKQIGNTGLLLAASPLSGIAAAGKTEERMIRQV